MPRSPLAPRWTDRRSADLPARTALPVVVDLPPSLAAEVVPFVEAELGWQVVAGTGSLPPTLALADRSVDGVPTAVVVADGDAGVVRAALLGGAVDVVAWPHERQRLADLPARLAATQPARPRRAGAVVRIGGVAGGVGTSTIALAIAGLLGWGGRDVVLVGDDRCLLLAGVAWEGPDADDVRLLPPAARGREVADLGVDVPGVERLRVLRGDAAALADVDGWGVDAVVADVGVVRSGIDASGGGAGAPVDVLVARPDVALACAGTVRASMALVVRASGPLGPRDVAALVGRRPDAVVPESGRVALAALRGRVPSELPGSFLAALRGLPRRSARP